MKLEVTKFTSRGTLFTVTVVNPSTGEETNTIAFPKGWKEEELAVGSIIEAEITPNNLPDKDPILNKPKPPKFNKPDKDKDKGNNKPSDEEIRMAALQATASMLPIIPELAEAEEMDFMPLFNNLLRKNENYIRTGRWAEPIKTPSE